MNELPTVMKHSFSKVPNVALPRSTFDRSHGIKTTFDASYLIPILVDEVLPGDTLNCRLNAFARLATPLKPVMDNLYLDTFFFFVPNRLLWTNWEKFCGAQQDPGDSTSFTIPQLDLPDDGPEVGSLADYFGLPTDNSNGPVAVNSLHFRAYNRIWNEWFRDQNLQDSVVVDQDNGSDTYSDYGLLRRGKRHDYFTSCLPWPQKGDAVELSLATSAPIEMNGTSGTGGVLRLASDFTQPQPNLNPLTSTAASLLSSSPAGNPLVYDPDGSLIADLTSATAVTINQLREAEMLQVMLERDARGGTRYVEHLKSMWGVTSPDFRLQRSEYLGGGSSPINIHPVPMTGMASGGTAAGQQGNLAGFGTVSFQGHGFNKAFVEHGVILGLACVTADLTYQQGLHKMWSRQTREEFYHPPLANLGEQAVLNKEIYAYLAAGTGSTQRDGVFGYQERWAEYRYKNSQITGIFRSQYATPLDVWHLSQEFGSQPTLNSTFINEDVPLDRVIAVATEPHILFDGYFKYIHTRVMPTFSIPSLGARL